ncbi:hypothetical protein CRG98_015327 [Punica granatum]|uniref:Uncharacterized protein n=1 Tax=Punica granatum TaxID=22663 RepID=A0A2I0K6X0_PUNGR|nr:hypothetical protein CRG98_015327 [Punica granatum]
MGFRHEQILQRSIRTVSRTPYYFCRTCSTRLSSGDPASRAFPRETVHAYSQLGKICSCDPRSRSNHSRVVMTRFSETNIVCMRLPMGRGWDKNEFSHGTAPYFLAHIPPHNRLIHHLPCQFSQGHAGHRRRMMHGLMPLRELLSTFLPYTFTGKGSSVRRSPCKAKDKND